MYNRGEEKKKREKKEKGKGKGEGAKREERTGGRQLGECSSVVSPALPKITIWLDG